MDLSVQINKSLNLKNPVINASGTFAYGEEFSEIMDISRLGAVVTKGLSLNPKTGNPVPRICETACGMINAIGLENIGVHRFITEKLPVLNTAEVPIIANFFGNSEDEYAACAKSLSVDGVSALEMNVSCPNVKKGGIQFGTDPQTLRTLVGEVRKQTEKALIVKLSPMVSDIVAMAEAACDAGADAITCANTFPAMAIDPLTRRPVLGNTTGGLSGPAIKPITMKLVWEIARNLDIPVIASGGITNAADVLEFIIAGASAVEIGAHSLRDPFCFGKILDDLEDHLEHHGIRSIEELRGSLII